MTWNQIISRNWQRYLLALLIIAAASAIRAVFFRGLGRNTTYLTYYPAVVIAAIEDRIPLADCRHHSSASGVL